VGWVVVALALAVQQVVAKAVSSLVGAFAGIAPPTKYQAAVAAARVWVASLPTAPMALLGGALATWIGLRWPLLIASVGMSAAVLLLVFSPIREARELEQANIPIALREVTDLVDVVRARVDRVPAYRWTPDTTAERQALLERLDAAVAHVQQEAEGPTAETSGQVLKRHTSLAKARDEVIETTDELIALLDGKLLARTATHAATRPGRARTLLRTATIVGVVALVLGALGGDAHAAAFGVGGDGWSWWLTAGMWAVAGLSGVGLLLAVWGAVRWARSSRETRKARAPPGGGLWEPALGRMRGSLGRRFGGLRPAPLIAGTSAATWWGLGALPGWGGTAEAAVVHDAATTSAGDDGAALKAFLLIVAAYAVYRLLRAAGAWVGSALRALRDAAIAWGGRQLTRLRWVLLGAGAGWMAAANGYGVLAAGVGVLLSVVPALALLIFALQPDLRGYTPVAWVRDAAEAWYGRRLPWQIGAGLLVGVALWAFMGGGDPTAVAMAAAFHTRRDRTRSPRRREVPRR
jgi:hypothetical protein